MFRISLAAALFGLSASPALAKLPESTRAMIDAAIATGDAEKVNTVLELARTVHPEDAAEIDAIKAKFDEDQKVLAAAKAEEAREKILTAGLFDNWSGKGELGGFRATGNSSETGLTAALALTRDGLDWRHKLRGRADFRRADGETTREQFFAAYEPNYKISDRLFIYGLAQYERDRFQGFSARYAVSGGLGYQIIDQDNMQLSAKVGPAYRITQFVDGGSESRIAGLAGVDFDWDLTDRLKLTHDTNAVAEAGGSATLITDGSNTSVNLVTGLNAKVSDKVTARFSYAIEYDSNPPEGAVGTDTLSRVTLIYDF
ncbi:DUF481 domain-containing protein [Altererythrobacter lutimaris]|uniref:DUF481 domain-containing protein n=1 Tax=Altererythrobacter lutimaris TaxID=2743979 RepID=A0A850H2S7_9SPHN|nr:DUF481 domain-containing protein [Altererythrobacter lutimaris]NVE93434.1 DUF481 domain-containing protein [Altererythrobacter lutimaris]